MKSKQDGRSWEQILVGFAVDVSGSMQESIRNERKMGSVLRALKNR
ncbi:MAG: hypothetical protein F6K42_24720 [Leptolyngbya sp. SIO1D8]|nr:hypothetical protein [Leptolyngbya sp. SIO1D8]